MARYTTSLAWMCAKYKLRKASQAGSSRKAVDTGRNAPTLEEFDAKGGLSKDWKPFLEQADQICLEDPEDLERIAVVASYAHMAIQAFTQYVLAREAPNSICKISRLAAQRAKAAVQDRLASLALEAATGHPAAASDRYKPAPAVQPLASTVITDQTVDSPAHVTPPSEDTLDGQNPEDLLGRTLVCYEEDEPPYRYTVRCHCFGPQTDWFALRSEDGFDDWELTPEEMRLQLKKSTLAHV